MDLDRHRLSLGEADHARFAAAQKAIAEGRIDPDLARYDRLRLGIDRALGTLGIDLDGPAAIEVRADARDQLKSFEVIEGRAPNGRDIDDIVKRAIGSKADTAVVREASDPFNPQHVAPAGGGRPPSRSQPQAGAAGPAASATGDEGVRSGNEPPGLLIPGVFG